MSTRRVPAFLTFVLIFACSVSVLSFANDLPSDFQQGGKSDTKTHENLTDDEGKRVWSAGQDPDLDPLMDAFGQLSAQYDGNFIEGALTSDGGALEVYVSDAEGPGVEELIVAADAAGLSDRLNIIESKYSKEQLDGAQQAVSEMDWEELGITAAAIDSANGSIYIGIESSIKDSVNEKVVIEAIEKTLKEEGINIAVRVEELSAIENSVGSTLN